MRFQDYECIKICKFKRFWFMFCQSSFIPTGSHQLDVTLKCRADTNLNTSNFALTKVTMLSDHILGQTRSPIHAEDFLVQSRNL